MVLLGGPTRRLSRWAYRFARGMVPRRGPVCTGRVGRGGVTGPRACGLMVARALRPRSGAAGGEAEAADGGVERSSPRLDHPLFAALSLRMNLVAMPWGPRVTASVALLVWSSLRM